MSFIDDATKMPYFTASTTVNRTYAANTNNTVIFNNVEKNSSGTGGYSNTTGIFTAPVSGVYHFTSNLPIQGQTTGSGLTSILTWGFSYGDGASFNKSSTIKLNPGQSTTSAIYYNTKHAATIYLAASDQIKVVFNTVTYGIDIIFVNSDLKPWFSGYLVAATPL